MPKTGTRSGSHGRPAGEECRRARQAFVGGFTHEGAEAVADADLVVLAALAERSLIQRLPDAHGGSRYQEQALRLGRRLYLF
jgi:hypothetical protein